METSFIFKKPKLRESISITERDKGIELKSTCESYGCFIDTRFSDKEKVVKIIENYNSRLILSDIIF